MNANSDTERLDWLENNKEAWSQIESPEAWPDKLWHIGSAEDHLPLGRALADNWSCLGRKTLREAIDAAMSVKTRERVDEKLCAKPSTERV